jgi:AraC family transcriptional regulator
MTSEMLIKGMVCERCVFLIKEGIKGMGYDINKISLGKLSFITPPGDEGVEKIQTFLSQSGFELISSRQSRIVNQVKEIINTLFNEDGSHDAKLKFSSLISDKLNMNYDSISELFSQSEGITLEKYIITKRLEKVKELLVYSDFTLTEIAHKTGFSSINHLSRQFKQHTGLSPSQFRTIRLSKQKVSGKQEANL